MLSNRKGASFGTIVAVFGSILIALGVAWLIAQNWHQLPSALKIIILLAATSGTYTAGTMFRAKNYSGIGKALLMLGALLYTLSIFLIAQIYFTSTSLQGTAWLFLISWVGVIASAYIFDSSASLVVGLVEFVVWLYVQFFAFYDWSLFGSKEPQFGILAFYLLATGLFLYGLSLFHRSKQHKFSKVYQWWTAFYFLYFSYTLSFQTLLPMIWPKEAETATPPIIFLFFLVVTALFVLIFGIITSISKGVVQNREIMAVIGAVALLALLIGFTSFVSGQRTYWFFGSRGEVSTSLWAVWIFSNIILILLIVGIIFYGTWQKLPKLINLGIVFFGLDIITRYLGFIMDLWGYTSLSVIFITGGIVLLAGGWLVEKWRRNMINKAKLPIKPKAR